MLHNRIGKCMKWIPSMQYNANTIKSKANEHRMKQMMRTRETMQGFVCNKTGFAFGFATTQQQRKELQLQLMHDFWRMCLQMWFRIYVYANRFYFNRCCFFSKKCWLFLLRCCCGCGLMPVRRMLVLLVYRSTIYRLSFSLSLSHTHCMQHAAFKKAANKTHSWWERTTRLHSVYWFSVLKNNEFNLLGSTKSVSFLWFDFHFDCG